MNDPITKKKNWSKWTMLNIPSDNVFWFSPTSNLRLEHEFDRRVEEFHFQGNGHDHEEERINIIPVSVFSPDKWSSYSVVVDFDWCSNIHCGWWNEWIRWEVRKKLEDGRISISFPLRLKRRLEQYEHDRQVERVHANRLQAKREADIEARLRKDRVCIDLQEIRLDIHWCFLAGSR